MAAEQPRNLGATLTGALAIALFSTAALLSAWAAPVPPFQLMGMAFALASILAIAMSLIQGKAPSAMFRQPWRAWALGVGGFFGFHFCYFVAMQHASPVEASLITYLWPLLIVLFSALLPGSRLHAWHVAGGFLGMLGTCVLVGGAGRLRLGGFGLGEVSALAAAVTWAGYTVLSRRFQNLPSTMVGGYCAVTAILAWVCHGLWEPTVLPRGLQLWAIAGLGLGPLGGAFFAWDHAAKHGDLPRLGQLSYGAPLLSTLWLMAAGRAHPSWSLMAACSLIVGGAVLGRRGDRGQPWAPPISPATQVPLERRGLS